MILVARAEQEHAFNAVCAAYVRASVGRAILNARYYDGGRGQFLSEDPSFLALGNPNQVRQLTQQEQVRLLADPQQLNSYSYARNNPVRMSDPTGLMAWESVYEIGEWVNRGLYARDLGAYISNGRPAEHQAEIRLSGGIEGTSVAGQIFGVPTTYSYQLLLAELSLKGLDFACSFGTCAPPGSPGMTPLSIQRQVLSSASPQASLYSQVSNNNKLGYATFNNLFSDSAHTRQQAAVTINSSAGLYGPRGSAPNNNSVWVTPSGAVVTFGGALVAPPPTAKK